MRLKTTKIKVYEKDAMDNIFFFNCETCMESNILNFVNIIEFYLIN